MNFFGVANLDYEDDGDSDDDADDDDDEEDDGDGGVQHGSNDDSYLSEGGVSAQPTTPTSAPPSALLSARRGIGRGASGSGGGEASHYDRDDNAQR